MTTRIGLVMLGLFVMARALSAAAHHTAGDTFDTTNLVALRGTLASVEWKNPHVILHLDTRTNDGQGEKWSVETLNVQGLSQRGLNEDSFKQGQTLSFTVCVKRDGARFAVTHSIAMPNGDIEARVGGC